MDLELQTQQEPTARQTAAALKFLLSVAALRSAPKSIGEICGGSNHITANVCYIHPDDLRAVPGYQHRAFEGIHQLDGGVGFVALIVATKLMPRGGVIYAPLNQAVLDHFGLRQTVEDFPGWNHTSSGGLIINAGKPARTAPKLLEGE